MFGFVTFNLIYYILSQIFYLKNRVIMSAIRQAFKAYVSEEILHWHSLCLSLSADICIHFHCPRRLRQASQRKMIQSSALRLRL